MENRQNFESNLKTSNETLDKYIKKKEENPSYVLSKEENDLVKEAFGKVRPTDQNIAIMINRMKQANYQEELQLIEEFKKIEVDHQFIIIELMKLIAKIGKLIKVPDLDKQAHWLIILEKNKTYNLIN